MDLENLKIALLLELEHTTCAFFSIFENKKRNIYLFIARGRKSGKISKKKLCNF